MDAPEGYLKVKDLHNYTIKSGDRIYSECCGFLSIDENSFWIDTSGHEYLKDCHCEGVEIFTSFKSKYAIPRTKISFSALLPAPLPAKTGKSFGSDTPKGFILLKDDERVSEDCLVFRDRWDDSYYWETTKDGYNSRAVSQIVSEINSGKIKMGGGGRSEKYLFAKPRPRFETTKPFPYGY